MNIDADMGCQAEHHASSLGEEEFVTRERRTRWTSRRSATGTSIRVPPGNRTRKGVSPATGRTDSAANLPSGDPSSRGTVVAGVLSAPAPVRACRLEDRRDSRARRRRH
jgi:hypothetical protein